MQAVTRKQQAQAPEIGIVASPARAVAVASSRQRMPSWTCAQATKAAALEREAEHLEVGDVEPPPDLGRPARELPGLAVSPERWAM